MFGTVSKPLKHAHTRTDRFALNVPSPLLAVMTFLSPVHIQGDEIRTFPLKIEEGMMRELMLSH